MDCFSEDNSSKKSISVILLMFIVTPAELNSPVIITMFECLLRMTKSFATNTQNLSTTVTAFMIEINTPFLHFQMDDSLVRFSLSGIRANLPNIQNAHLGVQYHPEDGTAKISRPLAPGGEFKFTGLSGGPERLEYRAPADTYGLAVRVEFTTLPGSPLLIWRMELTNQGGQPLAIDRIDLLQAGGQPERGTFELGNIELSELTFFKNGWQSWSHSGAYPARAAMLRSRLGPFQEPMVINAGTPALRSRGYFSSDFFGVISHPASRSGLLLGFLSQKQHFGCLEAVLYDRPSLHLWANGDSARLDPGCQISTDWAVALLFDSSLEDPLGIYLDTAARENEVHLPELVPSGWCSWYHFYTHLSAENIQDNLKVLAAQQKNLPLPLVQIDDGFESQVGDWFSFKPTFPEGVAPLAAEIKQAGLTPGLWLAPFIVHPKSHLAHQHPDYLLRDRHGRPANAGFVWNAFGQALDLTVPEALDYSRQVIATAAHEWGYPYLKLDFLYAAALPGVYYDATRTRAQVLRMGMQAVREAAGPDTFLLGCGAPLGSVLGLVEANRIGADVSGDWTPRYFNLTFPFKNEPHMPCARNSIQNILARSPMHGRWWVNDPDCLLVRPDTHLSLAEVQTLASAIAMTGGSLLLSDDLPGLPQERLDIARVLMPVLGRRAEVLDLFERTTPEHLRLDMHGPTGDWHVLARFNSQDKPLAWQFRPADFNLPDGRYLVSSFWDGVQRMVESATGPAMPLLAPHGCALLAVYPDPSGAAAFAGSNLHFSQGVELKSFKVTAEDIRLRLELGREANGWFSLWLPAPPMYAVGGEQPLNWQPAGNNFYHFSVAFDDPLDVCISLV